jgi:uncharacterized protein (TIGR02001 family)
MKSLRTVRYSLIAAAVAGAAVVSTPAFAGVSATAGVASLYLWRGQNLGGGTPVVSGSLDYGHDSGIFAGVWGSSGDTTNGHEIDLYAGYGYSSDAMSFKVTAYDYTYPRGALQGALQEVVLSFGASGAFVDVIVGMGDFEEANYVDFGYTMDKITGKVGMMMADDTMCTPAAIAAGLSCNYTHVDVTYAYNKNLSFTVSGVADADDGAAVAGIEDPLFVVSYALPLDLK